MKRLMAWLAVPAVLAACGGGSNPFTPAQDTGGAAPPEDGATTEIPEALAGDVTRFVYDPDAQTLRVEGMTFDGTPIEVTYRRRPGMDITTPGDTVPAYEAYTAQDDPLDRHFTAYVGETSNEGAARAGVTVSGGPRNRFFAGGYYERDGDYDPPEGTGTSGMVSYAGTYAALTNGNGDGGDLAPVPAGTAPELVPTEAAELRGDIFLQADFADNAVEGNIINRQLVDSGTALPSVVLVRSGITDTGTFEGSVEYEQRDFPNDNVTGSAIGSYGGTFGGTDASGVAGLVKLEEFDGPNDDLGFENEVEHGVFVLDQCGQAVDAAICANVNP